MEYRNEAEPDIAAYDYPPVVDPASGPLLSNKYMPPSSRKIETTPLKPEPIVREDASWLDPAIVMLPFSFKHLRTSSLPEATMPVSKATDEHCSPALVYGSIILPYKRHITKASSNTETALVISGVVPGYYPPRGHSYFVARDIKKHRRSLSSGEVDITQLPPKAAAEEREPWADPYVPSMPTTKYRRSSSNGQADMRQLTPKVVSDDYESFVQPESLSSSSEKDKPNPCLHPEATAPEPEVTSDVYILRVNPISESQPENRFRVSSNASNFWLLPPQEWTPDTHHPIIDPASIPLPTSARHRSTKGDSNTVLPIPTIIVTTPDDKAEQPSESTSKLQRANKPEILDSSRLHPNAAWSQLANWTHKTNLKLVDENEQLRLENGALKDMLVKFSHVLNEMGMDKQMEFQKRLNEMPAVLPKSEGGGPRGAW